MASDKRIGNRFRCESGRRGNFLIFYARCFQFCLQLAHKRRFISRYIRRCQYYRRISGIKFLKSVNSLGIHHLLGDIGLHHRLMSEIGIIFYRKQIDHTRRSRIRTCSYTLNTYGILWSYNKIQRFKFRTLNQRHHFLDRTFGVVGSNIDSIITIFTGDGVYGKQKTTIKFSIVFCCLCHTTAIQHKRQHHADIDHFGLIFVIRNLSTILRNSIVRNSHGRSTCVFTLFDIFVLFTVIVVISYNSPGQRVHHRALRLLFRTDLRLRSKSEFRHRKQQQLLRAHPVHHSRITPYYIFTADTKFTRYGVYGFFRLYFIVIIIRSIHITHRQIQCGQRHRGTESHSTNGYQTTNFHE